MALLPYLGVFLDGNELQVWMLHLLLQRSVQVWLQRHAVPLVQEIKRGECVLQRANAKQWKVNKNRQNGVLVS